VTSEINIKFILLTFSWVGGTNWVSIWIMDRIIISLITKNRNILRGVFLYLFHIMKKTSVIPLLYIYVAQHIQYPKERER